MEEIKLYQYLKTLQCATNYVTLQGNKITTIATSDDSVVNLGWNPAGNVNTTNDLSVPSVTVDGISLTNNSHIGGNVELTECKHRKIQQSYKIEHINGCKTD